MKKILSVLLASLVFSACTWPGLKFPSTLTNSSSPSSTADQHTYALFTVNTQEFVYSEQSVEVLNKLIDLHESKHIPVDIYLDHAILQTYEQQAPKLLERLKTSPMVAVSYHMRPPLPYARGFDWKNVDDQSAAELKATLERYETHAIDFTTGETTDEPGGYQHLKDLMGYAPPVVGFDTEPELQQALLAVYKNMGASFVVQHPDRAIALGDTLLDFPIRPETSEIILTEKTGQTCDQIFGDSLTEVGATRPAFINLKVHDNDFIASQSAWVAIYLPNLHPTLPPFDVSLGTTGRELLSQADQDTFWNQYAECVGYVAEHPDQFTPINAFDLVELKDAPVAEEDNSPAADGTTPILASVVTHIEEPGTNYPNFVDSEQTFWQWREDILRFAEMLHEHGVAYNFQSDWNFLLAVQTYDQGTDATNGKNLVKYMKEDLGVEIDPHAHGKNYNYADVAYLINQLGVESSHLVGGYLVAPTYQSELEKFWSPMQGAHYEYTWQADILWGAGSPNHTQDYIISGVWKPKDAEHFAEHSDQAPLPTIGSYTGDWDGVQVLLEAAAGGSLEQGNIYTASLLAGSSVFLNDQAVAEFEQQIVGLQDEVASGSLEFVYLADVIQRWKTDFNSQPTIYTGSTSGTTTTPTPPSTNSSPLPPKSGNSNQGGACGDGICQDIEKKVGLCPEDCN